ncbi:MAG: hypothetical protein NVS2B7_37950 [Herpetosiphon sp.]
MIKHELGAAGNWTINDSPVHLLITATQVEDGKAWYFVRDNALNSKRTGSLSLVDCVVASAAEPTYFEPWIIREDAHTLSPPNKAIGALVGGGVGVANNPVYQACVEAFFYTTGFAPAATTMVSLGTGRFSSLGHPTWLGSWLRWVLDELLRSPHEQQTEIVQRQFPEMTLYRVDTRLARDIAVDDVGSIDELRSIGEEFAQRINWPAILDGTDKLFRIGQHNTLWSQYSQPSSDVRQQRKQ